MMQAPFIHDSVLARFSLLVKENRLAHAYLFAGPAYVGKSETALSIAKLLDCEHPGPKKACDACPSCVKINNGNHPDVHLFEAISEEEEKKGLIRPQADEKGEKPKNREIRINQIRYLITQAQLRPFEAKRKIFILKNVEEMSAPAANAFLKVLEEPTATTLFILTTAAEEKVFDTIQSRCQIVSFAAFVFAKLEETLVNDYHIDKAAAHFLALFAEGNLGKARVLEEGKIFKRKNDIIDNFVLLGESERYLDSLVSDKEKTKEALDILYTWFRDLMLVKSGVEDLKLIHLDRAKDLKKLEGQYSLPQLEDALGEIVKTSKLLDDNLNLKVALPLMKEKLWRR